MIDNVGVDSWYRWCYLQKVWVVVAMQVIVNVVVVVCCG